MTRSGVPQIRLCAKEKAAIEVRAVDRRSESAGGRKNRRSLGKSKKALRRASDELRAKQQFFGVVDRRLPRPNTRLPIELAQVGPVRLGQLRKIQQ